MHQVEAEITRNRTSAEEQKRLIEKLSDLKNQVEQLSLAASKEQIQFL
jgi:phenylpyruvate tautomerase PptA (4-oxalocrotonate tautomerase family)